MVVIDLYEDGERYVLINPEIVKTKGIQECDEGCLSFPNKYGKVDRPEEVVVEYTNLEGKRERLKAKGLFAECICHEIDHLSGILFTDLVKPGTLEIIEPQNRESRKK